MQSNCSSIFFFSSRRRHTRCGRDWSSDVCSSDLAVSSSSFFQPIFLSRQLTKAEPWFLPLRFSPTANTLKLMAATDLDVKYVAHLARLSLTPAEEQKFRAQLAQVLGYIEKLNQLDVSHVEPTAHAVPLVNVTRLDEIRPSISNEDALKNAPAKANGLFIVPKIVE